MVDLGLFHALAGEFGLFLADRDTNDVDVEVRRGMDGHRTPSASDVEQAGPLAARWLALGPIVEAELAADEFVLCCLRVVERGVGIDEACARVRHRRA